MGDLRPRNEHMRSGRSVQDKPVKPVTATPLPQDDRESNRFTRRVQRYARVGSNVGGIAARIGANYLLGAGTDRQKNASQLAALLRGGSDEKTGCAPMNSAIQSEMTERSLAIKPP